jgi:type III secretion protein V
MSVESISKSAGVARPRASGGSYSDIVLACGVVAIVALMILPLRTAVIDALVAVNISVGVGLLLVALYIPSPVAFSSFPSVLLITTLFRLSLAIATTRLILLDANAGHIILTFGKLGAGGNLVVGVVVFLIITIVQFIVIAKGAERVAEVAARFTLDAMPGKQLSIDSDLRSGLVDKDEAKRRRRHLELESQLYGSLDGAMKFVKGDAIAGIVIIVVNLLGGLAVGMLQKGMNLAQAIETYSILTIGDGLVMQIPALLGSIAAGLVVTRTASEERDRHLGEAIARQVVAQPRVLLITGAIALFLTLVPGFPKLVFVLLGCALISAAVVRMPDALARVTALFGRRPAAAKPVTATSITGSGEGFTPMSPLLIEVAEDTRALLSSGDLARELSSIREALYEDLGVIAPAIELRVSKVLGSGRFRIRLFEVATCEGALELEREAAVISAALNATLRRNAGQFLGIQEVNALIGKMGQDYPDLIKEVLRVLSLQKISDVMRRLVEEGVSVRNLRDIFESLADAGAREKDSLVLAEFCRVGLKRYLSERYAGSEGTLKVFLLHPEFEEKLRQSIRGSGASAQLALDPELARRIVGEVRSLRQAHGLDTVVLASIDIRRHVRKLVEGDFHDLAVLSYQELTAEMQVLPLGQLGATRSERLSVAS